MGIRLTDDSHVALYDSATGRAFGPTFTDHEEATAFLESTDGIDLREYDNPTLETMYGEWLRQTERAQ